MQENELVALISLLEDPDREVFEHVFEKLSDMGESIIPTLESAWEESFDANKQQRIEELIHKIQFDVLCTRLIKWNENNNDDLLAGAILLAQYQFPDLDEDKVLRQIESIRQDIWVELNANLTPLEEVNVFNQVFYGMHKFSGSTNFNDPGSSFINNVLDTRKGNSLSLGVIYLILTHQLNLPVYGVDLPNHFVLAYTRYHIWEVEETEDLRKHIQFYINPLNKGLIFTYNEIKVYLKKMGLENKIKYFVPTDNVNIMKSLIRQLGESFAINGSKDKKEELDMLYALLDTETDSQNL